MESGEWRMEKKIWGVLFLAVILCGLCMSPMQAQAYFGTDEDYLLRTQKPEGRGEGPFYYLEFVSEDEDSYIVQEGDTLWGIAREYYGSGTAWQKLWDDNAGRIASPETLQIGTKLDLEKRLYVNVGMQDYVRNVLIHDSYSGYSSAWEWEPDSLRYEVFPKMTYRNDLDEKDPYRNWEVFQTAVTDCSRRLCGDRVSGLSFERYQVTDVCDLCFYQFVFEGDRGKYLIMAAFVYTGEIENEVYTLQNGLGDTLPISHQYMKQEVFTVCDLGRCSEADLEVAKGKTFYMAARTIDSGAYLSKTMDNIGADEWDYPQLHNPFVQAMQSFCDEPLARTDDFSENQEIQWKDPVLEKMVREQLAGLWQLTEEEKKAFMARPVTTADLAGVKRLDLYENRKSQEVVLQLNNCEGMIWFDAYKCSGSEQSVLTTLDDLAYFKDLRSVNLYLNGSDIVDFSALGEITGLRELTLETDNAQAELRNEDLIFLEKLKNLRRLHLFGQDQVGDEMVYALDRITDLSVLENCPQLAYLMVNTGNVENYDFLGKLPELYQIELMGREDMLNVQPDTFLMPNACFIEYYGEQIRFDVGGSKEIKDDEA